MGLAKFLDFNCYFFYHISFYECIANSGMDGGHALFTIVEMVTGRKPTDKVMEYAQTVGMVLLLGLMAYALGLDFFRLFHKS